MKDPDVTNETICSFSDGLAAMTVYGRSPLIFVDRGVKFNQQNYEDDKLVGRMLTWVEKPLKNFSVLSAGLCNITCEPKV